MKLGEIWKRIGKQPLAKINNTEAFVFIDGHKYKITKCHYENGILMGFDAEKGQQWFSEMIKPKEDTWVTVRDEKRNEHDWHQWNGHCWYHFSVGETECDGWPSDVDIVEWKYQFGDENKSSISNEQ